MRRLLRPAARVLKRLEAGRYGARTVLDADASAAEIARLIDTGTGAVAKIGESELRGLRHVLRHGRDGRVGSVEGLGDRPFVNAGVFPRSVEAFNGFAAAFLDALGDVDALSVWFNRGEAAVVNRHAPEAQLIALRALQPLLMDRPYTRALTGRRLLVVTPFAESVRRQAARLDAVWARAPRMLSDVEVAVLEVPLSHWLVPNGRDRDWAAALERMKCEMAAARFDVALIGAGAWSLPLAVHAKRLGRVGIHQGGYTQLLFGIHGGRWDENPEIADLVTDAWVRPLPEETPERRDLIEGGCYW